jgi:hypothetical protein
MPHNKLADPGGRVVTVIVGSNPAEGMDVCLLCLYVVLSFVGRGLWNGLMTHPEESYCASNCVRLRNLNTEEDKARVWAVVPWGGGGGPGGWELKKIKPVE